MRYYTCKCGEYEFYGSGMNPEPCFSCKKCGTNCFKNPAEPHVFYQSKIETDDGYKQLSRCKYCFKTKREIDHDNNPPN